MTIKGILFDENEISYLKGQKWHTTNLSKTCTRTASLRLERHSAMTLRILLLSSQQHEFHMRQKVNRIVKLKKSTNLSVDRNARRAEYASTIIFSASFSPSKTGPRHSAQTAHYGQGHFSHLTQGYISHFS